MNNTTKAPHCPRCGGQPKPTKYWCERCDFNGGEDALGSWPNAVRAELARQALEMRAHGHASETEDFDPVGLVLILPRVMKDYELLGWHPLRLPGEDNA